MALLLVSILAGMLTVLAPCILPLLPVVVGSVASGRNSSTPYVVVGSLSLSVILFTFLLKVSTVFVSVPAEFWATLSGLIIIFFGATLLWPDLWDRLPGIAKLSRNSNQLLGTGFKKKSVWGDVLVGLALGPIFSTCSPTYFVILATVLPASLALGTLYLLGYVAGLAVVLLFIALLGERLAGKLAGFGDPHSRFKKVLGWFFIVLGFMIMFGLEKKIESALLESGIFDITKVETTLLQRIK